MNANASPAEPSGSAGSVGAPVRVLKLVAGLALLPAVALMAFAVLGPMVLPYRAMVVRSGSMDPTIPVGALAVYRPASSVDLAVGDIIAFAHPARPGETVTHRIVSVEEEAGQRSFVTKGDANGTRDEWRVPASGTGWRHQFSIPVAGRFLAASGSTTGRTVVVGVVVAAVAAWLLRAIWRPRPGGDPTAPVGPVLAEGPGPVSGDTLLAGATRRVLAESATLILGHSDLLLRSMALDDTRRADVEAIRQAGERVVGLVRATAPETVSAGSRPVSLRTGTRRPAPSAPTRDPFRSLRSSA